MAHSLLTLNIEEMLRYCACPLKFKLWKEQGHQIPLTKPELYSLVAKEALRAFFSHIVCGGRTPHATMKAVRKFDEVWLAQEHRLIADPGRGLYDVNLLITHIHSFYNGHRDEVVGTDFPICRTFNGRLLLKDSVDLLIINHPEGSRNKKSYRGIQFTDPLKSENERYSQFRFSLFRSAIQQYLGPKTQRKYHYEIRPTRGPAKQYSPGPIFHHDVVRVAGSVAKAINQGIYFPTTSKETCKDCPFNKTCTMSLTK